MRKAERSLSNKVTSSLACIHGPITKFTTVKWPIRTKKSKNFGPCIRAILHSYCYYNLNPCGIFENMTSFSPIFNQELEQGKLMAAVDSQK